MFMGRRKKGFDGSLDSASLNNQTYIDIYNRLQELAMNSFKWKGLPDSVDERFLEYCLYWYGYCLYFNDDVLGNLALTCTIGGELDVYRIPIYRRAYANNGYQKDCDKNNSVLIFNNYLHTPTDLTIRMYARRLYEIQRAIDVNIKRQKTPQIVLANEQQMLTMQNLFEKYDGNQPFIFGYKDMIPAMDGIVSIDTTAPFVADKLRIEFHNVWNEALTFCGIENSNSDKRERLVSAEVGGNYGHVEAERNVMLNMRRRAAEEINKMFGTNIEPVFNSGLVTPLNAPEFFERDVEE